MYIGVIGQKDCSQKAYEQAYSVGKLIAQNNAVLVCGGMYGIMEGAAKGAFEAGGLTVGILPGISRIDANPFIKVAIPTGLGIARNTLVVRASDVLIAVTGGYGTLSEIAFALACGKRVIGLNTWKLEKEESSVEDIIRAKSPKEAVLLALKISSKL